MEPNVNKDAAFLLNAKYTDPVTDSQVTVPIAVLKAPVDSTPLELVIDEDEELVFSITGGDATIHLTGYFILDNGLEGSEFDEIDMEDLEDDIDVEAEALANAQKRKIPLSVPVGKKPKTEAPPQQKGGQQKGAPQKKGGNNNKK